MKTSVKPLATLLCLAGIVSLPVWAADNNEQEMKRITAQTKALETQLAALRHEVRSLKRAQHVTGETKSHVVQTKSVSTSNIAANRKAVRDQIRVLADNNLDYFPLDLYAPGQAFVSTGPYIGIPMQYAGSNLIVNSPSINLDVQLLRIRKRISNALSEEGLSLDPNKAHSHLLLSGVVEGKATYVRNHTGPAASDISLSSVGLTATILGPSNWTTGFFELSYDDGGPNGIYNANQYYRVSNSRIFVSNAFIVLGDLTQSPVYGTVGQYYVPFGTYSSVMITDPMSKVIGRTKARAGLLGFKMPGDNALYGSAYLFRGDSKTGVANRINNGGLNVGYKFNQGSYSGNVGAGYISNVTDSAGMQSSAQFWTNETITRKVPAYNLHALLSLGTHVDLIAEYVKTKSFNSNDMTFNGHSAQPWALDTSASYSFTMLGDKPSSVGIGYAQSGEALALGLPKQRYSLVFNTSLFRNTLQALELRRDKEYGMSNSASSAGIAATPGSGKYNNAITAQFSYYF